MWVKRTIAVVAVTVGGVLGASTPALANDCGAGYFCAYERPDFVSPILKASAAAGAKVDVADDRVCSADNETPYTWVGKNRRKFLPDQTVFTWAPGSEVAYLGDACNKIDHFDVQ